MHERTSKYRFFSRADGFRVEASDRAPVTVKLCETGFCVHGDVERQLALFDDIANDGSPIRYLPETPDLSLFHYRRLVDLVAAGVMSSWTPTTDRTGFWQIGDWALKKTRRALGGRIHEQWRRLIAKADPTVVSVQKAVFAATIRDSELLHSPLLYQDRYLVQDIVRHRAAAALVPIAEDLYRANRERCDGAPQGFARDSSTQDVINGLSDWQGMCSCNGVRYRSLSRTLMRLPGGVPCGLLYLLPTFRLPRPVTSRLELITLLLSRAETVRTWGHDLPPMKAFLHGTQSQIREGMHELSSHLGYPLRHRRTGDISTFVQYHLDFPDEHRGDLPGLVRKSIRWHQTVGWNQWDEFSEDLDETTPTRRPPIPLPDVPGIRFLESVGDVINEGDRMDHCIGSYARRAVQGGCFLFHVDYEGQCASVEVDPAGHIRQSRGPGNCKNEATKYAAAVLSKWSSCLSTSGQSASRMMV